MQFFFNISRSCKTNSNNDDKDLVFYMELYSYNKGVTEKLVILGLTYCKYCNIHYQT